MSYRGSLFAGRLFAGQLFGPSDGEVVVATPRRPGGFMVNVGRMMGR